MNRPYLWRRYDDPVVVGGIGGSGTRLIAECLIRLGYFLGSDLNEANDNLWFTLLFKRIDILSASDEEFDELLEIVLLGMRGVDTFSERQIEKINTAAAQPRGQLSATWLRRRAHTLLARQPTSLSDCKWGWKEPNTHVVLDRLLGRLHKMKYIHVARNGLDMAFSDNQNQLALWGSHFIPAPMRITPYYSLKYWCSVHQRILAIGSSMGSNFMFLNYDEFCANPTLGSKRLCEFLELEVPDEANKLIGLIRPPSSIGRFRRYGAGVFAAEDIAYVASLGFDVRA